MWEVAKINIYINELLVEISSEDTVFKLRDKYKKDADVVILNGFPISQDLSLSPEDKLTFIKKGEIPNRQELEAMMVARHTPRVHNMVKKAVVGIAGAGGLGSNIAISLARVGVGKLIICDFDVVEPSNLNRQQYYVSDLGKFKVDALKDILEAINPFIEVIIHKVYLDENNIEEIFKDCIIVIEAFDSPICKATIANTVLTKMRNTKLISGSGMAGYFSSNIIKTRRVSRNFYLCGDEVNEAQIGSGLMAPRVAIAANHMANMALRLLCDEGEI